VEFGCLLSFITGYGGTFSHSTVPAHVMISTIPSTSTFLTYAILGNEYFADQHAYRLKIAFVPSSTPFSGISSTKPNSLWDPTPRPCTCHSCVQSCFRDLKTPYSAGPATTQSYRPDQRGFRYFSIDKYQSIPGIDTLGISRLPPQSASPSSSRSVSRLTS
jgi:hypothetical protein